MPSLVGAKVLDVEMNSSALGDVAVPPATSTLASRRSVAVCSERVVVMSAVGTNPTLTIVRRAVALRLVLCEDVAIR